jgi:hypothetical protein
MDSRAPGAGAAGSGRINKTEWDKWDEQENCRAKAKKRKPQIFNGVGGMALVNKDLFNC